LITVPGSTKHRSDDDRGAEIERYSYPSLIREDVRAGGSKLAALNEMADRPSGQPTFATKSARSRHSCTDWTLAGASHDNN
jgi:hypothetical protein